MFRLNGDIIKQLENIYGIKFLPKYKNELKERIMFFFYEKSNSFILNSFQETIKRINSYVSMKDEKIVFIKDLFFQEYKEELFLFFNPTWYNNKQVDKNIYKEDHHLLILTYCSNYYFNNIHFFNEKIIDFPDFFEKNICPMPLRQRFTDKIFSKKELSSIKNILQKKYNKSFNSFQEMLHLRYAFNFSFYLFQELYLLFDKFLTIYTFDKHNENYLEIDFEHKKIFFKDFFIKEGIHISNSFLSLLIERFISLFLTYRIILNIDKDLLLLKN